MIGNELRQRIDRLGLYYTDAARLLGLTMGGLHHQMRGERAVTRQTEIILEQLERGCIGASSPIQPRRQKGRKNHAG
jgi:hypothetical protein